MTVVDALRPGLRHTDGPDFEALAPPDIPVLSRPDLQCRDEVIEKYGEMDMNGIKRATHDAVWTRVHGERRNGAMPWEEIVATLRDSELLIERMRDPHPG